MHSRTVPMMLWILLITRIKNRQSFHQLHPSESVVLQALLGVSEPEDDNRQIVSSDWKGSCLPFKGENFQRLQTATWLSMPCSSPEDPEDPIDAQLLRCLPWSTQHPYTLGGINGWHQNHLVKNWINKQHARWRYLLTATTWAVCNVLILELVNRR